jgi:hypothetical protein
MISNGVNLGISTGGGVFFLCVAGEVVYVGSDDGKVYS